MRTDVRRRIEMAARVRDFCRTHPSDDPGYATTLARLEERLARADSLASQERGGRIAELASAARRNELRYTMQSQLLRHVVRIGQLAEQERPELAGRFRLRTPNGTHKSFLIGAKAMLAEAAVNRDLFVTLGLSPAMFDGLTAEIAEFDEATKAGNAGRQSHVGARADLDELALEFGKVIELLDIFNRFRFQDDPELLAAWDSARNLLAGPVRRREPAPPPPPAEEVTPPANGIAPAA